MIQFPSMHYPSCFLLFSLGRHLATEASNVEEALCGYEGLCGRKLQ